MWRRALADVSSVSRMKTYLIAGILAAGLILAGNTAKADMTGYDFSGLYLGVHAGGGSSDSEWTNLAGGANTFGGVGTGADLDLDGFIGGGQLGYMHQIGQFLIGGDVSVSASGLDDSAAGVVAGTTYDVDIDLLAMAQGRLGWVHGRFLIFAQGGYAGVEGTAVGFTGGTPSIKGHNWHNGWTVGGGLMIQIDEGLSLGAEYNYVDVEEKTYSVDIFAPGDVAEVDHEIHVFKITGTLHLGRIFGGL